MKSAVTDFTTADLNDASDVDTWIYDFSPPEFN